MNEWKEVIIETDLAPDQKEYINRLIEVQEKAYDPTAVIGGPRHIKPTDGD